MTWVIRAPNESKLRSTGYMTDSAIWVDGPKSKPSRRTLGMVVGSKLYQHYTLHIVCQ